MSESEILNGRQALLQTQLADMGMHESGIMNKRDDEWPADAVNWTCHHFTVKDTDDNVPDFLRLIASRLEELGKPKVLDIAFSRFWTQESGERQYATKISVYYD